MTSSTKKPPALTRSKADRIVRTMCERAAAMPLDPRFAYKVATLVLFGSYVSDKDPIGDIDVAIRWAPMQEDWNEHCAFRTQLISDELANGRRFNNLTERVCWPTTHALRHLRARDYALSFVDYSTHRPMLLTVPHRVVIGSLTDQ